MMNSAAAPVAGVSDGLLVMGARACLAAAFLVLGMATGLVGGLGLDPGSGGLQPGQALLAAVQLGGQTGLLAVDAEGPGRRHSAAEAS
jgi:hypothetical protein